MTVALSSLLSSACCKAASGHHNYFNELLSLKAWQSAQSLGLSTIPMVLSRWTLRFKALLFHCEYLMMAHQITINPLGAYWSLLNIGKKGKEWIGKWKHSVFTVDTPPPIFCLLKLENGSFPPFPILQYNCCWRYIFRSNRGFTDQLHKYQHHRTQKLFSSRVRGWHSHA